MEKTIADQFKDVYVYVKKQRRLVKRRSVPPLKVMNKFFSNRITKRTDLSHGKVQIIFKDNSMCEVATRFDSIKLLGIFNRS